MSEPKVEQLKSEEAEIADWLLRLMDQAQYTGNEASLERELALAKAARAFLEPLRG